MSVKAARRFAVADTCFLIDWSAWRRRDILFELFITVFVPESVLMEVRKESTLEWIADSLSRGSLTLLTETPDLVERARQLIERSKQVPGLRGVDLPESLCLVFGRRMGYVVLTENRGALMAADVLEELEGVEVWRALEVIIEGIRTGLLTGSDPFMEYERDTGHRFPKADLERVRDELRGEA
ncbi:MAG: hypothetical protein QXR35_06965 [Candidatus Korarchaeum sp.]